MLNQLVEGLRGIRANPNHYPRLVWVSLYNAVTTPLPAVSLPDTIESILILAQEKLGDAVLLMPFLKALNARFPSARVDVLCSRKNRYLFDAVPFVNRTGVYRDRSPGWWREFRQRPYQLFYNPKDHPSITANTISRKVSAQVRIGLDHPRHRRHYNHLLPNPEGVHRVEKNAALLAGYGASFPLDNYLPLTTEHLSRGKSILQDKRGFSIGINLSSGSVYRKWPGEYWDKVIKDIILSSDSTRVLLFATPKDRDLAWQLKTEFNQRIVFPLDTRDLLEAAGILKHCKLLISPDTSLIHVAAAVGVPVLGLYTRDRRNLQLFGPYRVPHEIISSTDSTLSAIKPQMVRAAFGRLFLRPDTISTPSIRQP